MSRIPALDPGMINVTAPAAHGYEFLPHGQTFRQPVEITLPYQPSLLPPGYEAEDVHTYYYDEELGRWQALARAEVMRDRHVVKSLTDHFTSMINAIVAAPEHVRLRQDITDMVMKKERHWIDKVPLSAEHSITGARVLLACASCQCMAECLGLVQECAPDEQQR